jgi:hypothetical protein
MARLNTDDRQPASAKRAYSQDAKPVDPRSMRRDPAARTARMVAADRYISTIPA